MFPPGPTHNQGARGISLATSLPHIPVVLSYNAPDTPFVLKKATLAQPLSSRGNRVEELIALIDFDGSFVLSDEFVDIVGEETIAHGRSFGANAAAWATALAIVYMRRNLVDAPDRLALLLEKIVSYGQEVSKLPGKPFDRLLGEAETLNF